MSFIRRTGRAPATLIVAAMVCAIAAGVASASASAPQERAAPPASPRGAPATGRVVVQLRQDGKGPLQRLAARNGLRVAERLPELGVLAAKPARGESAPDLRARLAADPAVESAEIERFLTVRAIPNDPAYSTTDPNAPLGDKVQWNLRREGFEPAWSVSKGAATKVGIVDTGVSSTQPDLNGPGQVAAAVDHDTTSPTGAQSDENGHGTHVAGLACADSDNGYGIASAGFDCRLLIEKLEVSGNQLTPTSIAAGIVDATDRGAGVINLSLGGPGSSTPIRSAINYAWSHDVVLVAAAENLDTTNSGIPATYIVPLGSGPNPATCAPGDTTSAGCSRGLVVTNAKYNDTKVADSDTPDPGDYGAGYGSGISVAAYGDPGYPNPGIFSTFPSNQTSLEPPVCVNPPCSPRTSFGGDTRFAYLNGTSMATPQVSGLAALIRTANPGLSASQVVTLIRTTARGGGSWEPQLGFGIIDAGKALAAGTARDVTAPSSRVKTKRKSRSRKIKIKIASDDGSSAMSSGVASVSVFVAKGKGRYVLLAKTTKRSLKFKGKRRKRYRFYSRAIDGAGNREAAPASADSVTKIRRRPRSRKP